MLREELQDIYPLVGCEFVIPDRPNLEWRNESYYASWLGKICYLFATMQRGWAYGEKVPDDDIGPFFCHAHFNDAHHVTAEHQTFYGARCLTTPVWMKEGENLRMEALKKPIFRAFEFTRNLKGQYIPFSDEERNIFGVIAYDANQLHLCIVLHNDFFQKPPPQTEITLKINNLPRKFLEIEKSIKIDKESANPYEVWKGMNSPQEISSKQYEQLVEASKVKNLDITQTNLEEKTIEISFTADGHSFNFISLN